MSTWLRMCSVPVATTCFTRLAPVSVSEKGAGRAHLALGLDAVRHGVAGCLVWHPRQAEQGLVEMDVPVDQRRQEHDAGLSCLRREEGSDVAVVDLDVVLAAVG